MKQIPISFECSPYGDFQKITPLISKGRLRIYYLGKNRNRTYITEEFSLMLEKNLPYVPIVGLYDKRTKEFGSHASDRNDAATYGLVPENPNINWEEFLDSDGVKRNYLCCDVYLYTGRYDAANRVIGKKHSMELNPKSIDGVWREIDGEEYFVFTNGFFDGLSVLGDKYEPCFEGAAFFQKEDSVVTLLEKYVLLKNKENFILSGGNERSEILDNNKDEFGIENVEENVDNKKKNCEENNPDGGDNGGDAGDSGDAGGDVEKGDDIVSGPDDSEEEKKKDDNDDDDIIDNVRDQKKDCEKEENSNKKSTCELTDTATFEEICEKYPAAKEFSEKIESEILELKNTNATLELERDSFSNKCDEYKEKQDKIELEEKDKLINSYAISISEEALNKVKENINTYSIIDLEKELLYILSKEKPDSFKKSEQPNAFSSLNNEDNEEGIIGILNRHKKNTLN
jgi:hypothetical protein